MLISSLNYVKGNGMSSFPSGLSAKAQMGAAPAGGEPGNAPAPATPPGPGLARIYKVSKHVLTGITQAAKHSGVDFGYLMATAARESNFDSQAAAKTSSARGLFQMINQTWLGLVKNHGAEHGLAAEAAAISQDETGQYGISDPAARQAILDLRHNPAVAATMGANLARDNQAELQRGLGRPVGPTELYLAHFLGGKGALQFLQKTAANPGQAAADLMPAAAAANPAVFYDRSTGKPLTLGQVYDHVAASIRDKMAVFSSQAPNLAGQVASPSFAKSDLTKTGITNSGITNSGTTAGGKPPSPVNLTAFSAFAASEQARLLNGLTRPSPSWTFQADDPVNWLLSLLPTPQNPAAQRAAQPHLATRPTQASANLPVSPPESAYDLSPDSLRARRREAQAAYLRPRDVSLMLKV